MSTKPKIINLKIITTPKRKTCKIVRTLAPSHSNVETLQEEPEYPEYNDEFYKEQERMTLQLTEEKQEPLSYYQTGGVILTWFVSDGISETDLNIWHGILNQNITDRLKLCHNILSKCQCTSNSILPVNRYGGFGLSPFTDKQLIFSNVCDRIGDSTSDKRRKLYCYAFNSVDGLSVWRIEELTDISKATIEVLGISVPKVRGAIIIDPTV